METATKGKEKPAHPKAPAVVLTPDEVFHHRGRRQDLQAILAEYRQLVCMELTDNYLMPHTERTIKVGVRDTDCLAALGVVVHELEQQGWLVSVEADRDNVHVKKLRISQ